MILPEEGYDSLNGWFLGVKIEGQLHPLLFNPFERLAVVFLIEFKPYVVPLFLDARYGCGATAHEWVKNYPPPHG